MFDYLLESSHQVNSNKWSNSGFGEEITQVELVEVYFTHLIWSSVLLKPFPPQTIVILSPPNKLSSTEFLVCFNCQGV